jgi:hypothetical protein
MNVSVGNVTKNGNQVTVTGSTTAGATVNLTQNGVIIATVTASNVDGSYSITGTVNGNLNLSVSGGGRVSAVEVPL